MESFINVFIDLCLLTNQTVTKHTSRNIWHTLTESRACGNIYCMQMPFLIRAIFQSKIKNTEEYTAFIIPESFVHMAHSCEHDGIFLMSAKLCLRIKEKQGDMKAPSRDLWLLPSAFCDIKLPVTPCYVELFLYDIRYIGGFVPEKKTTMMHYAINKSPIALQEAWANFKEFFFKDDCEGKKC